jgi:hypothetical protein
LAVEGGDEVKAELGAVGRGRRPDTGQVLASPQFTAVNPTSLGAAHAASQVDLAEPVAIQRDRGR